MGETKFSKILQPQYMNEFKCIGKECMESCCVKWNIPIDKDTYKKYKDSKNEELKDLFSNNIKRWRSKGDYSNYAKIKLKDNGECPFLDKDKLCSIYKHLGEDSLSTTCTVYPRDHNKIDDSLEISATMSCPEAARLALLNKNPMEFDCLEKEIKIKDGLKRKVNTNKVDFKNKINRYLWDFRIFTISLLQNRNYRLWERLTILGLFFDKVGKSKLSDSINIIANYNSNIEKGLYKGELSKIPSNMQIQSIITNALTKKRVSMGTNNKKYMDLLIKSMEGIGYGKKEEIENNLKCYEKAYNYYTENFEEKYEYILENYLVNDVFKEIFPLKRKNLFENYEILIVKYAIIRMHLIGLASFYKDEFTEEKVVSLIQSFSRVIEHNDLFIQKVYSILKENNIETMAYMAMLLK
ncbi:flagellin lysine-N-methylase [Clostridium oceanicum]|uniref:Flagellin lysine-N-methylase n=1 Tax=Clostridium oceanicum TaxID=1543 RepID=A0ABP3V1B3_9CLOT